jgi:hypothetical protein
MIVGLLDIRHKVTDYLPNLRKKGSKCFINPEKCCNFVPVKYLGRLDVCIQRKA